jgi:hypothetical protein
MEANAAPPTGASAPPDAPPPRRTRAIAIALAVVVLVVGVVALRGGWRSNAALDAELATLATSLRAQLPFELQPGVVMESATVQGTRLVTVVRADGVHVADWAHRAKALEALRRSEEQAFQQELCAEASTHRLLGAGATIVRRFVDADGKRLFDLEADAADCLAAP